MIGGLTEKQWQDLEDALLKNQPPPATEKEMASAPHVTAITIAGSDAGVLLNAEINKGQIRTIYINAIAALALAQDISGAGELRGWWKEGLAYDRNPELPFPTGEKVITADYVTSFLTSAAIDGVFLKMLLASETVTYAMSKNIAMELMLGIFTNGQRFGWLGREQ